MGQRWRAVTGLLVGLAVMTAGVLGMGGRTRAATAVTLYLDWSVDGIHAPFFVALKKGWYTEIGLTVDIRPGQGSGDTVKVVGSGRAPFGFADAATMVKGVASGAPVKMVAVLVRKTPAVILCKKGSGIRSIRDLVGKSIGDAPQTATATLLPAVLEANGMTMRQVRFVSMSFAARVPSVLEGKVDCALGYIQEFVNVRDRLDFLPYHTLGIVSYSSGILVNARYLASEPEVVRRFVRASLRGMAFVMMKNREEAAEITASYSKDPGATRAYFATELEVLGPYFVDDEVAQRGLGWMSETRWKATQELMVKYGGQKRRVPLDQVYTNAFLPPKP